MQGRLIKSGPLSDPAVIQTLNRDFVPVFVDPSDSRTAGVAPALALWEKTYSTNWAYRLGFSTSVIISADGKIPLAASGIAKHHWRDVAHSANHSAEKCVVMLQQALDRHHRYTGIQQAPDSPRAREDLARLQQEIVAALQAVSPVHDGRSGSLEGDPN